MATARKQAKARDEDVPAGRAVRRPRADASGVAPGGSWGLRNRLARFLRPDGRTVMLAVDHGYFLGPTSRLEVPRETIAPLLPHIDSLMCTRGVLRTSVPADATTPVVLRVSGGPSVVGPTLADEHITTAMKDALRLNCSGVGMSLFVGTAHESQTVRNLGELVTEGEEAGMPVLAITAVGKELEKRDARYLGLCTRIAAEIGAHVVKTYYCEGFDKVVEGCMAPIVVAGGPKLAEKEALELTYNSVAAGAAGVDMGRNIWQSDHPVAMVQAVRAIVHEDCDVREAWRLYGELAQD
jgi:putative autoinducer-2 (AI-2) aldolase